MIDKHVIIETLIKKAKSLALNHYLDIRTYKRNRGIIIVKKEINNYYIMEDGYYKETFHIEENKLRKLLQTLIQREFPRSHKIRVYTMGVYIEDSIPPVRKIL